MVLKKSIREVEALDSEELSWWLAADHCGLLPDSWQQTAQICHTIAQGLLKRKDRRAWQNSDFMPVSKFKPWQTDDQIFDVLESYARMHDAQKRNPQPVHQPPAPAPRTL